METFQYLNRAKQESWRERLLTTASSDRMRGNSFKLESICRDVRKELFTQRVVGQQNRFPRGIVDAPTLAVFKARSDGTSSSLVSWKVSLPIAGRLELDDP